MCIAGTCPSCHLKSWWGCGKHVEAVMDKVPDTERCTCLPTVERNGKTYPPMTSKANYLPAWATPVVRLFGHIADDSEVRSSMIPDERRAGNAQSGEK